MKTLYHNNFTFGFEKDFLDCGYYVDEHGKPVTKTRHIHPYSYDPYVQERCGPNSEATTTIYSDRLLQWNYKNTRRLLHKHFYNGEMGSDGDYYNGRSAYKISKFLSEWFRKKVKVVLVMEGCNVSNGYPYWIFWIRDLKKGEKLKK